jgi:tetratricopeptide (TPR) repeat protein
MQHLKLICCLGIFCWGLFFTASIHAADEPDKVAKQVQTLIDQLGDDQFTVRERAMQELRKMGLPIYELLLNSGKQRDPEITSRVNRLINDLRISIAEELPVGNARDFLTRYFLMDDEQRLQTINNVNRATTTDPTVDLRQLTRMNLTIDSLSAYCRIVRFETNDEIAKQAALLILRGLRDTTDKQAEQEKLSYLAEYFTSATRPATKWLQLAGKNAPVADQLKLWREYLNTEKQLYEQNQRTEQKEVLRKLAWHLLTFTVKHDSLSAEVAAQYQELNAWQAFTPQSIQELVDLLTKHESKALLAVLKKNYPELMKTNDPRLLYLLAEVELKQGNQSDAEALAKQASQLQPEAAQLHYELALFLSRRGHLSWMERECQIIMALPPQQQSRYGFDALVLLAEKQNDQERFQEASETFGKCLTMMRRNERLQDGSNLYTSQDQLRAKQSFNAAMHASQQGDDAKAYDKFLETLEQDNDDADSMIGLYRLKKVSPAQRQNIEKKLDEMISRYEENCTENPHVKHLNEYAWLVSNTRGDFDLALKRGLQATAAAPLSGGLQDTLAHCYAAKGDYANAVKIQRKAVELEPSSQSIARGLARFEKQLAEQPAKPK